MQRPASKVHRQRVSTALANAPRAQREISPSPSAERVTISHRTAPPPRATSTTLLRPRHPTSVLDILAPNLSLLRLCTPASHHLPLRPTPPYRPLTFPPLSYWPRSPPLRSASAPTRRRSARLSSSSSAAATSHLERSFPWITCVFPRICPRPHPCLLCPAAACLRACIVRSHAAAVLRTAYAAAGS